MTPPRAPAPRPAPEPAPPAAPRPAVRGVARATVDIAAPPERVFRALTDPAELAAWWARVAPDAPGTPNVPTGPNVSGVPDVPGVPGGAPAWHVDARPGGRWGVRATDAAGRESSAGGEFRVVDPPHTLEYTWRASRDGDALPSTVRYELAPAEVDGALGTRVTVTHTSAAACARAGLRAAVPAGLLAGLPAGLFAALPVTAVRVVRPAWPARGPAPAWAARPGRRARA